MNPQIGMKFNSYEEITSFMNEYKQTTLSDYWIRDNRTLQSAGKRMKKDRFDTLNQNFKYSYVKFSCIHGGQKFREKIKTSNRKTFTFKQECGAFIYFSLSKNGKHLVLKSLSEEHNHVANTKKTFNHLPNQRKLNKKVIDEAVKLQALRPNKKLLLKNLSDTSGQTLLLRDITNISKIINTYSNDLAACLPILEKHNCEYEVLVEDKEFRGLFFQNDDMKRNFDAYPEIGLLDSTYKLLNFNGVVYLFIVEDSIGCSEIIAVGILVFEIKEYINWSISTFKSKNDNSILIKIFMTDKDETMRSVLKCNFSTTKLILCKFHVFQIFKHEITSSKLGITSIEETRAKEYLQQISYAKSDQQY
ncbi:zinc finger SWIM domain-containing protein 3-like [Aphis craccivora]|uniref:Zinc finger SWIM domain-containing protein 3-like n=2 Tax=Aphis craccivora TaxID=307492 RepID=A0A6G0W1I0_APHCR|nr:zinc finger SWIM domain-containing protein 3-like [Aphis craccivora]